MAARWPVAAWVVVLLAGPAAAQTERYELGRRMKAFERLWDATPDPAARARALDVLPQATTQFLSFRFGDAARTLDRAAHALRAAAPPDAARAWADALAVAPAARLVDAAVPDLAVTVRPFYPAPGGVPAGATVTARLGDGPAVTVTPDKLPATLRVPFPKAADGPGADLSLVVRASAAGGAGDEVRITVSRVRDLAARLAALKKAAAGWPAADTIERATVRERAGLLAELAGGTAPESDVPAARLLAEAERMAAGERLFTADRPGDFSLSVPLPGGTTAAVRVFVPNGLDPARPVPVVVALHGAGGSENLFFEGYGAGRAVRECERRGWVLVATRGGLLTVPPAAAVLDALAARYPLDRKRAFLVGHSMGAAHTVELLQRHPGRFAAAAALGGGGRVRDPKAFAGVPLFVAAGEKDFALTAARNLHKAVAAGGAAGAVLREYPGLDHLVIVREALPDVFAAFDRAAR